MVLDFSLHVSPQLLFLFALILPGFFLWRGPQPLASVKAHLVNSTEKRCLICARHDSRLFRAREAKRKRKNNLDFKFRKSIDKL